MGRRKHAKADTPVKSKKRRSEQRTSPVVVSTPESINLMDPVCSKAANLDSSVNKLDNLDVSGNINDNDAISEFVPLPWFLDVIASLELCIARNSVPIICGPVGCGKTASIDYLAKTHGAQTFRMQISEQTDTKALLGAYCCSTTPGIFIWRPGPLIHCMTSGKWLILEDVDKGSADLPILLSPVLRHKSDSASQILHPNSGEPITRHPSFRLILTSRTSSTHGFSEQGSESEIYSAHCPVVYVNGMSSTVIEKIVQVRFPSLVPLAKRLLVEFPPLKWIADPKSHDQRAVCSRDFFKFCSRAQIIFHKPDSAKHLYLDALDCFVCSQRAGPTRDELAVFLGGLFNFTKEQSLDVWRSRRPQLQLNKQMTRVEAGRATLPINCSVQWELQMSGLASSGQTFADTRLACNLVERLAVAVDNQEPVLLVGETGTGKTSSIQRLARMAGRRLRVLNLNQQSDSVDLLGGFKPVDTRALINPVRERFEGLFARTFRLETNRQFLGHIQTCAGSGRWRDLLTLIKHPTIRAIKKLSDVANAVSTTPNENGLQQGGPDVSEWRALLRDLQDLEKRITAAEHSASALAFAFIEGAVVRALAEGDWVLLDEINLAPAELLDCLAGLLDSVHGSLTLIDRGDLEPVKRHPGFHLFAAMNPSTDVGKRDLPIGLRNRFTEFQVEELNPMISIADREDLALLVRTYLIALSPTAAQVTAVVELYSAIKKASMEGLVDGVGQRPYFSLRTLCRALTEASRGYHGSLLRSLYEGFLFSFGSQVGRGSRATLERLIQSHLVDTLPSRAATADTQRQKELLCRQLFERALPSPSQVALGKHGDRYVCVEGYWVPQGPQEMREVARDAVQDANYVLTESVRVNLKDLARVVSAAGSLPVLLQGETSVGKTSLITYLAGRVGQVCHRINNHEHTDLQTYLGAYTAASSASSASSNVSSLPLIFQEGIFVQAMKKGHWIILDELNLAPTEILEALNRVLDENRELFITETQEMVKAHPHFRVFATQNPPGLYAGRKVLSRALRNRFVEIHFDTLPRSELEIILEHRSALPKSRAKKMVEVMHQLQLLRRSSDVFQGKDGFITLRDLFRWGERYRLATCTQNNPGQLFDWDVYLAEHGYLLLAGRARHADEARAIAEIIEKVFKTKIDEQNLFDLHSKTALSASEFLGIMEKPSAIESDEFKHVVWTRDMRRLLVLIGNALKYKEPVLLVGETGCGKTTVCQIFASLRSQKLHCVNCHQYTEASDFLGGLRPVRSSAETSSTATTTASKDTDRLFEWVDGPLVNAMLQGDAFLLDEISLADDAVLERLNSILEPERQLCLAERCGENTQEDQEEAVITATETFRLLATMNPGGDFAKKELSPALRNRFTEIWCPSPLFSQGASGLGDWRAILEHNMRLSTGVGNKEGLIYASPLSAAMVDFCWWFAMGREAAVGTSVCRRPMPTVRDLLAWVEFIHNLWGVRGHGTSSLGDLIVACLHGASLIFLDSLDVSDVGESEDETMMIFGRKEFMQTINQDSDHLFDFTPTGGTNYLLTCLLKTFNKAITTSHDGTHLLTVFTEAASKFHGSLSRTPGHLTPVLKESNRLYGFDPFFIETGPVVSPACLDSTQAPLPFSLAASTPATNLCRLLRALQLPKRALLLEGSPGVGKTSLVMALARASGHSVVRINLSEATEASDLFGCDLPVEGAGCGSFAWRDGPLLQALRHGHWILLDEMNLASQSVLECLNACLDHRGSIFIPELGTTFHVKPRNTRLFACQNPVEEGGGRKALPKSFLNRFTQVHLKPLTPADQIAILCSIFQEIPRSHVEAMVAFNSALHDAVEKKRSFGTAGGPWEFNLRDLCRWGDLMLQGAEAFGLNPGLYVYLLYAGRMRTNHDKTRVVELWNAIVHHIGNSKGLSNAFIRPDQWLCYVPRGEVYLTETGRLQVGLATWDAVDGGGQSPLDPGHHLVLNQHRPYLEMLLKTLQLGWMCILVGPRGAGKRSLAHLAAFLTRRRIATVSLSPSADTVELLGAFEQRETGGVFSWIDSPLVTGIREGHWVLLENAQLCSPSVLDRLNSLLEPGGDLLISERGLDSSGNLIRLKPHPEFRLILTVDEKTAGGGVTVATCNNISRAMRNRGVELVLTRDLTVPDEDLCRLLLNTGLPAPEVDALLSFEAVACERVVALLCSPGTTADTAAAALYLPLRRPPVGALLSAGFIIQQLRSPSSELIAYSTATNCNHEPNDADGVWWLQRSWANDHGAFQRAFAKALSDVYVKRQTDSRIAQAFTDVIKTFVEMELLGFLDDSKEKRKMPLLNRAFDLVARNSTSILENWKHALLGVIQGERATSSEQELLLLCHRFSMEHGFRHSRDFSKQGVSNFLEDLQLPGKQGMDLRWIPGWRCLFMDDGNTLSRWNVNITSVCLDELDRVMKAAKLGGLTENAPPPRHFTGKLSVLFVIDRLERDEVPIAFCEAYSGLKAIISEVSLAYEALKVASSNPAFDFYAFLTCLAKFVAWIRHFGSSPIGDPGHWPERREFFRRYNRSSSQTLMAVGHLMEVIQHYHAAPSPRPVTNASSRDLSHAPWSHFAHEAHDQLSTLLSTLGDDDNFNTTQNRPTTSSLRTYLRLWPVLGAGLVFSLSETVGSQEWSQKLSRQLLLDLGISVGALSRPRLLGVLTSASEKPLDDTDGLGVERAAFNISRKTYFPSDLTNVNGLVKPDLSMEWQSLSQAVLTMNSDDLVASSRGEIGCSFADWVSHQQTMTDLFYLLQRMAPACTSSRRILHKPSDEIPQLLELSKSLICAVVAAIHKECRGQMCAASPHISKLEELTAPLQACSDLSSFSNQIDTSVMRLLVKGFVPPSLHSLVKNLYLCLRAIADPREDDDDGGGGTIGVARAWVLWGALQAECSFPASPLDPSIVCAYKISIAQSELDSLEADLRARCVIRHTLAGSCGLPCDGSEGCLSSAGVQSNVHAGLEHPLVGALIRRHDKVAAKLERLRARQAINLENEVLKLRCKSNIQYAELRRRLTAFNQNFTGLFLLDLLKETGGALQSGNLAKWIDAMAGLSEWLLQPERLHQYADIVEPYLFGLSKVTHGLRLLVQSAISKNENANKFAKFVETLSGGLFPSLATTNRSTPQPSSAMSPHLELIRQLVSPEARAALHSVWQLDGPSDDSVDSSLKSRSIFTDAKTVQSIGLINVMRAAEADFQLNSYIVDLLLLDRLSSSNHNAASDSEDDAFTGRLLRALVGRLASRWKRAEARRKRDAERRAALFIEAESKRRHLLDELQAAAAAKEPKAKKAKTRAERRQQREEALENADLPDLVDVTLNEEVEWRLRFSEAGTIEAQRCLLVENEGSGFGLGVSLSRDDQIKQTVSKIERVNAWYDQELAAGSHSTGLVSDWMPPDADLVSFIDRLIYLLQITSATGDVKPDLATAIEQHWWSTFMQGYQMAGRLLTRSNFRLPSSADAVSMPSHILATARLALKSNNEDDALFSFEPLLVQSNGNADNGVSLARRKRCLDVYRDPIPTVEARKAQELIQRVHARVLQVLVEWPEHPALLKIITVIDRLGAFSMRDCLMKYITAFEIVLSEVQEWEKNAARHVSLSESFKAVVDLLVDWRKLELRCWMASLDAATQAAADRCTPLWFHLHAIFLQPHSVQSQSEEQCQALLEFMENGPVGEFHPRWRLLTALHAAIKIWPGLSDEQRSASLRVVGNVAWFYGQFVPHVNAFLLEQQKPIRKEMRGFISVIKWGDYIGFWTMKENVDRCKKTIHKHTRAWESILRQSVKPCFETAIKTSIETPISSAALSALDGSHLLPSRYLLDAFELSPELQNWLCMLSDNSDLPQYVRRLPTLIVRFKKHVAHMSANTVCLAWTRELRDCLVNWMSRVNELSRATQQLDADSPPHASLVALLNEREGAASQQKSKRTNHKSPDGEEADMKKAKEWRSRFAALQQSKKLALVEWFRLASGRRRLATTAVDTGENASNKEKGLDDFEDDIIFEASQNVDVDADDVNDVCFGLSYRRGLRKGIFTKPRGHMLSCLGGDLFCPTINKACSSRLEKHLAANEFSGLHKSAAQSLARLLSLRSGLPQHPENPQVIDDLGGREGVECLLGSLDDLLTHCADAFEPLGNLQVLFQALKQRVDEIHISYGQTSDTGEIIYCPKRIMRQLKTSRERIASLSSECVKQWTRFWETSSSCLASEGPSPAFTHLLRDNAHLMTDEAPIFDATRALTDFRPHLEELVSLLDQRIPLRCISITPDVLNQQKLLGSAAHDFLALCGQICSRYGSGSNTLLSGLEYVAESIAAEVKMSGELIASAFKQAPSQKPPFSQRLGVFIPKILTTLQSLQRLDVTTKADRGMINQLTECTASISQTCATKISNIIVQLAKLTLGSSGCSEDVRLLRCVTPLLTSLLDALAIRLRQLWALLLAWLTLGEFMARVSFRLLNDGFCKPAALSKAAASGDGVKDATSADSGSGGQQQNDEKQDNDDGGCTSLTAEGVDTRGAKDVSKELQTQEQIEGTQDQGAGSADKQEDKPEPDNADGIEMPDDFEGAFDDGSGREDKKEEEENADGKQDDRLDGLDEQMGDTAEEPDEVNQEMWASDNEEEEEDESEDRKTADSKETGVQDESGKSKQAKSTAKEEGQRDEATPTVEAEGEDEGAANDNQESTTTAAAEEKKMREEQPTGSGKETVAGEAQDAKDPVDDSVMKLDEQKLAQQESELMETEEQEMEEMGADDDALDKFAENMDIQPNAEEFEEMDDAPGPDEDFDLTGQPMEIEEDQTNGDEDVDMNETEVDPNSNVEGEEPEGMVTDYQPGAGDLNSGNAAGTNDQEQNPAEQDTGSAGSEHESKATAAGNASAVGVAGEETGQLSAGDAPASNTAKDQSAAANQRNRGPRPTSDRRTTAGPDSHQAPPLKQTEILDVDTSVNEGPNSGDDNADGGGDAVQHVEGDSETKLTAFDSATDAQKAEEEGMQQHNEEEGSVEEAEAKKDGADPNRQMPEPVNEKDIKPAQQTAPTTASSSSGDKQHPDGDTMIGNDIRTLPKADMEIVETLGADRGPDSKFFTQHLEAVDILETLTPLMPQERRHDLDREALSSAAVDWQTCVSRSSLMSIQLCEALRLVLEPTKVSRMKGDFRTGKRLNMRKIIPYLASQFRKDKIWMRRTQPTQRDYRILIAVDNSSSMADNLCKQMTFEALATVISALNLLEAGKIGVCSFGESVQVVHGLGEPWSNEMGATMLAQFDFKQSRTSLTELLQTSVAMMRAAGEGGSAASGRVPSSQLLLVLSDGVFSEDPQSPRVQAAVRLAREHNLFIVCVIIDDAKKKHSIFDLRRYAGPGRLLPYMDVFPLPYYLVLRDVTALPQLLADALRQWFELAATSIGASPGDL